MKCLPGQYVVVMAACACTEFGRRCLGRGLEHKKKLSLPFIALLGVSESLFIIINVQNISLHTC